MKEQEAPAKEHKFILGQVGSGLWWMAKDSLIYNWSKYWGGKATFHNCVISYL